MFRYCRSTVAMLDASKPDIVKWCWPSYTSSHAQPSPLFLGRQLYCHELTNIWACVAPAKYEATVCLYRFCSDASWHHLTPTYSSIYKQTTISNATWRWCCQMQTQQPCHTTIVLSNVIWRCGQILDDRCYCQNLSNYVTIKIMPFGESANSHIWHWLDPNTI